MKSRRALTAALLVVLAFALAAAFSPKVRLLVRSLAGSAAQRSGEARDPEYTNFLEAVRRLTPPDSTITLVLPSESQAYLSEATSRLAPRRIVLGRENEATFVAAYRYQYRELPNADVTRVPNGALFRRQVLSR